MKIKNIFVALLIVLFANSANSETIKVATVNNGDMIRMQGLTNDFTSKTGINVCLLYTSPSPRD